MVRALISQRYFFVLVFFLIYTTCRVVFSLPVLSKPRELADTTAYLRISRQSLLSEDFWGSSRPFVFPLLLKIAGQDIWLTATIQLGFSVFCWSLLALLLSSFIRTTWLAHLSFLWILLLSLIPHLGGWDFTMLSESMSISWFVLFLACSIWLLKNWNYGKMLVVCIVALFMSFARDTNAYLLLMVAFLLFIAVILGWATKHTLILVFTFTTIFVINNTTADLGKRWIFPLINVIGRRVLIDPGEVHFLQTFCDMPVSPKLMSMRNEFANGKDRAFYVDPELEDFRTWLLSHGKYCYARMLLSTPVHSIGEPLMELDGLIYFRKLRAFYSPNYDPLIPFAIESIFYPVQNVLLVWVLLTLGAITALFFQLWKSNKAWSIFILLSLTIFPHLFITWHGDAMDTERHAIIIGVQIALASWILIILLLDRIFTPGELVETHYSTLPRITCYFRREPGHIILVKTHNDQNLD